VSLSKTVLDTFLTTSLDPFLLSFAM